MSGRRLLVALAVLIAIAAIFFSPFLEPRKRAYVPPVQGRKNTTLFLVLPEHGFSNVHLATAQALLERHPQIDVQFAGFPILQSRIERISDSVIRKNAKAKPIVFHALPGRPASEIVYEATGGPVAAIAPPGVAGIVKFLRYAELYASPWPAPEHLEIYKAIKQLIEDVDPSVVVIDPLFAPAKEATRQLNRAHVSISPNTLADLFAFTQPYGAGFWKFPMMGSGLPFPVPWYSVPSNIYQVCRLIFQTLHAPVMAEKRKYLRENGIENPLDVMNFHREDVPWISPATPGASIPVDTLPRNVSGVGPISLSLAPIEEQDPTLLTWLKRAPTVMINLGSAFRYSEDRALIMASAVGHVLNHTNAQILWKMTKATSYSDGFLDSVKDHIESGRLRVAEWVTADPVSILESGQVRALVHHGGASSYNEAVAAGVPHVILPMWADLYNYAALVESLNLGVWGCPGTSPSWTSACIGEAILKILQDSEASWVIRNNTQRLGAQTQVDPGRYAAARIIARLAGSGK